MKKLNILTLHRLGNPARRLQAVEELEFMLPLFQPQHNYIMVDVDYPVPDYIRDFKFDAVILNPTFLGSRVWPQGYQDVRQKFDFIRHSDAVKLAFPQDDYYSTAVLEQWMIDWQVDHVYTVCPQHQDILYPRLASEGIGLSLAYTGYASANWVENWRSPKARDSRLVDVCYRTLKSPPYAGSMSYSKYQLGDNFVSQLPSLHGLKLDISSDINDKIPGSQWHDFIQNARFCLVGRSGSSLFDPHGEYRAKIRQYVDTHPDWTFEEVKRTCFAEADRQYEFTAISPRNLEAALAETVQIAHRGDKDDYNGLFQPDEHYIPIEPDASNILEVLEKMQDQSLVGKLVKNSKELVLDTQELHSGHRAKVIIEKIYSLFNQKSGPSVEISHFDFINVKERYLNEIFSLGFRPSLSFPQLQSLSSAGHL